MADSHLPQIVFRKEAKAIGLTRYFTGRKCRKGHLVERFVASGNCINCAMDQSRRWNLDNKNRVRAKERRYREKNRHKINAAKHRYDANNREKLNQRKREYDAKNREAVNARQRMRRTENKKKRRIVEAAKGLINRLDANHIGLSKYFTGKPCRNGHLAKRFTSSCKCVECEKTYRIANSARHRELQRKYRERNKEKIRGAYKRRFLVNIERYREIRRKAASRWLNKNIQKAREASRKWQRANPEKTRASNHKRRAIQRNAEGKFTPADIKRIRKLQRNRCAEPTCQVYLTEQIEQIDHIIPLSKGGSNWPRNLQLLCISCNSSKRARDPIEHARIKGRLL